MVSADPIDKDGRCRVKRSSFAFYSLPFLLALAFSQPALAITYNYTQIDVPGASFTVAVGINNSGQVTGFYQDGSGQHGFVLSDGVYSPVNYPGAFSTDAFGISNNVNVTGEYDCCGATYPAFLLSGGTFTTINDPRGPNYELVGFGVNNSGQVVGSTNPPGQYGRGFLFSGGAVTFIDYPGAITTQPFGINDKGQVVGHYADGMGTLHGFLLSGGVFTTIDYPGPGYSAASGINNSSQIVGVWIDRAVQHGYLLSGGVFTLIDPPFGPFNGIGPEIGINDNGQIVGSYGSFHGFLATPSLQTPTITWLAPAAITYPAPLTGVQLDAGTNIGGTFVYSPPARTVLGAGKGQTLSVTFTPDDTIDYAPVTATTTINVNQATPIVTWQAPAAIAFGGALGGGQLDAVSGVPGAFVYTPPAGTVLPVGNQTLSTRFTPNDTVDYKSVTSLTTITVKPASPSEAPANLVVTKVLTRTEASVVVQLTIANTGGTAATNVVLISVKVGAVSGTPLPQNIGTIAPGASTEATVNVPGSVGVSGLSSSLTVSGTYTGGIFNSNTRITLP